ncbi:MAG: class I SAM-dependent methyltransferase [Chitinophagaceae bacterium]|nr:class I SAM-dependent methyltransferase [Chitinophagaceae bacterium]
MGNWLHRIRFIGKYLQYYLTASNGKGHGTHSPFVFGFIKQVLNDQNIYPSYGKVEALRKKLKKDRRMISVEDLGAGTTTGAGHQRSISSIATHAAKPPKYAQLLFRMARYYQAQRILELGTSLGLTSAYLAQANENGKLLTLEGAPSIAELAALHFNQLQLENVEVITGNFDQTLLPALEKLGRPDMVFVDGNHRKEPTLRYFKTLLGHAGPETILIFDDIHWSREMEEAWEEIRLDPAVQCSLDLFFIGIVFFRKEFREKVHFTIRY